jgi:uncharacterized tellurite resistance protein B-like protein
MTQNMSPEDRLQLMKFVCSFAWADLRIGQEERDFVHRMVRRLHLSPEEAQLVEGWLQHPPPPDEVDPMLVPPEHRKIFLESALAMTAADGHITDSEAETYNLLSEMLS